MVGIDRTRKSEVGRMQCSHSGSGPTPTSWVPGPFAMPALSAVPEALEVMEALGKSGTLEALETLPD